MKLAYCMEEILKIGAIEAIRQEGTFRKETLDCLVGKRTYAEKHFGLYSMFTVETQRTYGTEEELLFMLGATKVIKCKRIRDGYPTGDVYCQGMKDTINNMKQIAGQYSVNITGNDYDTIYRELEESGKFIVSNYFCDYRNGRYDYYNILNILRKHHLLEEEVNV